MTHYTIRVRYNDGSRDSWRIHGRSRDGAIRNLSLALSQKFQVLSIRHSRTNKGNG